MSLTAAASLKAVGSAISLMEKGFGKIKSLGLFEMDKAMKNSALSMGIIGTQAKGFRDTITSASKQTAYIGVSLQDIAKIQSDYSEELGRSVQMNEKSLVAMGQLSKFADLGAEGAARMAAEMDMQGMSAEKTGEFMNQTLNDSHAMGVNASKVIKNIAGNIKMLNKYRFKDGVKGLAKMAMTASKLGVDMSFAGGMADKLFDIEGAVDMSAQLQVMGGAWAQMADPFHLMYMARNDIEGLTEEIANAAKQSMSFAKDGSIETSAMEMQRLRIVAQQTGLEYEQLMDAGKAAFKLSNIKGQIGNVSPELQEFIANTAEFKDGKATIMVNGNPKLLSTLSETDKNVLKGQMETKKTMEERAKEALTFDEAFTNMVNGMKLYLLPIITTINESLMPKLEALQKRFEDEKWGEKIESFAKIVGSLVETVGTFILENPIKSALMYFGSKVIGNVIQWTLNGVALAKGFNMAVKGPGGDGGGGAGMGTRNMAAMSKAGMSNMAKFGANFKGAAGSSAARLGGVAAGGFAAYDEYGEQKDKGKSGGEALGRAALKGVGAGGGAWAGAAAGAALGAFGGPLAPITVPLGALIGGGLGAWGGGELTDLDNYGVKDGLFAGSNSKRAILQEGKITPLDKKDDILAMKPGGAVDNYSKQQNGQSSEMKVEHSDIKFNGSINVNIPGTNAIALEIMKTTIFRNEIVRVFNELQEKNNNGGKVAGY